jgi:hypothetical protein
MNKKYLVIGNDVIVHFFAIGDVVSLEGSEVPDEEDCICVIGQDECGCELYQFVRVQDLEEIV